ncbi:ASCH domain-containing protein [Paenibacillus alvei]|uniref:ASCH domain-containing protein n=1 Tax=Paenibacillus alvei TaxID=44250 RepID=UPI00227F6C59|nr:ASCH domain-containing protein [Paenibacillus alvei]MCY7484310.1 ASCH domain-containing protein [Paenibacillus alvei]
MKAITIIQPWATLIALGEKHFETRSWSTRYRGKLAIHAGKKVDKDSCETEPIRSTLAEHGYTVDNLPTGTVVATCQLEDCWEVVGESDFPETGTVVLNDSTGTKMVGITPDNNELYFGDYSKGRFAWEIDAVKWLEVPIPAKGQQGLWNWNQEGGGNE